MALARDRADPCVGVGGGLRSLGRAHPPRGDRRQRRADPQQRPGQPGPRGTRRRGRCAGAAPRTPPPPPARASEPRARRGTAARARNEQRQVDEQPEDALLGRHGQRDRVRRRHAPAAGALALARGTRREKRAEPQPADGRSANSSHAAPDQVDAAAGGLVQPLERRGRCAACREREHERQRRRRRAAEAATTSARVPAQRREHREAGEQRREARLRERQYEPAPGAPASAAAQRSTSRRPLRPQHRRRSSASITSARKRP